jgi:hypothetical protein
MDIDNPFPPPQRLTPEQQQRIGSVLLDEISAAIAPGRPRHTKRRWMIPAAGTVTAVAAAAAAGPFAVTVPADHPGGRPPARHLATSRPTGRQILLAAAISVARQQPGKYWHMLINENQVNIPGGGVNDVDDQWVAHDGSSWTSPPCKAGLSGKVVMNIGGLSFGLGNPRKPFPSWSYDLVQRWPANAAALEARIATYTTNKSEELQALVALELVVPAPPGVRAAAYRAIAMFPGVQDRGPVQGGHAVFVPPRDGGPLLLVLDPSTGLIHSQTWTVAGGQMSWTVLLAQWTNKLPRVIPLNKYYCSGT